MAKPLSERKIFKLEHRPYWLGFIAIILLTVLVAFFQEDVALFNSNWSYHFTFVEFCLSLSFVIAGFLAVGVLAYLAFGVKFSKKTALWTGILALCVIIGIFFVPDRYYFADKDVAYYVTDAARFRFAAKGVVDCLYLYFFFAVFPKMIRGRKTFDWICRLFVVAVLGIILYSVIFEWDNYVTFFSQTLLDGQTISFVAFFENKNIFGMGLIFGFIASMYLHARYAKFWQIGFMIFFGIVSVVIDCRTAMVAEGIAFVAYMLCRFFMTLKKHPWRNSFAMAFFAFAALFILVPVLSPDSFTGFPFLANFGYLIQSSFLDMGTATMSSRSEIWLFTLELIFENAGTAIFGMGGELVNFALGVFYQSHYWGDTPVFSTHNGFLFVLAKFGIIGFIIYLVLLVLIVRKLIIWMKQGDRSCAGILFGLLVAMMHAIAENTMFFGSTTQMVAFLLLCIMPVLLKREEEERAKEPAQFHFTVRVSKPKAYYLPSLCLLIGVFFMAFAIASPSLGFLIGWDSRFGDDAFSYVVMAVLALVLPRFMHWIKKGGMAGSLFALVIYVASLVACYYLPSYISALICVVLLGIGVALTLKEEGQDFWSDNKKYLLTLLPFLVGGVVACTALCVIGYNIRMLSDYAVIALTVATAIAYAFVVFLTPLAKYSFPEWLLRLGYLEDRWLMKIENFRERRKEKKEEEELLPGVPAEEDEEGHQKYFRIYR